MEIPSTLGISEKTSTSPPDDVPQEEGEITLASNGNVIDDGLQRGLKNRHLVSVSISTRKKEGFEIFI